MFSLLGPSAVSGLVGALPLTTALKGMAAYKGVETGVERGLLPLATGKPIGTKVTAGEAIAPDDPKLKGNIDVLSQLAYGLGAGAASKGIGKVIKGQSSKGNIAALKYKLAKALGQKQQTGLVPVTAEQLKASGKLGKAIKLDPKVRAVETAIRGTGEKPLTKNPFLAEVSPKQTLPTVTPDALSKAVVEPQKLITGKVATMGEGFSMMPKSKAPLKGKDISKGLPFKPGATNIPDTTRQEALKESLQKFLGQKKVKPDITDYFTPADYQMQKMGFGDIYDKVTNALMDTEIEFAHKEKNIIQPAEKAHKAMYPNEKMYKEGLDKLYKYMNEGAPKTDKSIEAQIYKTYRKETNSMLTRMNKVRKLVGKEELAGLDEYILHALTPEALQGVLDYKEKTGGYIPSELRKKMKVLKPTTVHARTHEQRKGVLPESAYIKDPHKINAYDELD